MFRILGHRDKSNYIYNIGTQGYIRFCLEYWDTGINLIIFIILGHRDIQILFRTLGHRDKSVSV